MQTAQPGLKYADVSEKIIGAFYDVYNELGHGFLESIYEESMLIALRQLGLNVNRQVPIPVWFRGQKVGDFRADVCVDHCVLLELKPQFRRLIFDNERKKIRQNPRKSVARISA